MKKNYCINILLFLTIFIISQYSYSTGENTATTNNNHIIKKLKEDFKNLCNAVLNSEDEIINFTSYEIHREFQKQIQNKIKPLSIIKLSSEPENSKFPLPVTYSKFFGSFHLPDDISASKKHIYNASKIPLTTGYCVAAEGPNDYTCENFIALLGEIQARVSISLVSKREFFTRENKRIFSSLYCNKDEYFVDEIKSKANPNETMRDSHSIKLIDYYTNDEASLEYELLLINNKYHFRIYHTNWEDNETNSLNKIIQIILFMKKIKSLDIFKDSDQSPVVVANCNAGAGRTGTFISIWNLIENYLNNQEISNIVEFIVNARHYRSYFVYNDKQYGMIKYLSQNLPKYLNNLYTPKEPLKNNLYYDTMLLLMLGELNE